MMRMSFPSGTLRKEESAIARSRTPSPPRLMTRAPAELPILSSQCPVESAIQLR
jgi:hypothetical protein